MTKKLAVYLSLRKAIAIQAYVISCKRNKILCAKFTNSFNILFSACYVNQGNNSQDMD